MHRPFGIVFYKAQNSVRPTNTDGCDILKNGGRNSLGKVPGYGYLIPFLSTITQSLYCVEKHKFRRRKQCFPPATKYHMEDGSQRIKRTISYHVSGCATTEKCDELTLYIPKRVLKLALDGRTT